MSKDPFKDFLKAQADATRKRQNLPVQRTIGAAHPKPYGAKLREQTNAEKVADFVSGGATGHVVNAIDRARMGDFSGAASQATGGVKNAAIQALLPEGIGAVKGAAGKFVAGLGKGASMTMADLPERYAIMTAENPGGVMGAEATAGGNSQLAADARALGKKVTPVTGAYTDDKTGQKLSENSLLIHDIGQTDATALAQKHGQNSFVSQKGLHDIGSGKIFPSKGISAATGDTYTELPGGNRFVHDLDWENPVEPQREQSQHMVKQLMSQGPIFRAEDLEAAKAGDQLGHGTGPELPGASADSVVSRAVKSTPSVKPMNIFQRIKNSVTGPSLQDIQMQGAMRSRRVASRGLFGEEPPVGPVADSAAKKVLTRLPAVQAPNGDIFPAQNHGDASEMAQSYGHKEGDLKFGHMERNSDMSKSFVPLDKNPAADSVVARTVKSMVRPGIPGLTKEAIPSALENARTPAEVRANAKRAWEAANAPVEPQPTPRGLLVDRSQIQPLEGASTAPLPTRAAPGPRASTGQLKGVGSDEANAINQAFARRGLKMMPNTFYPSAKVFFDAMGNAGGDPKLLRQATSAAAISNSVPGELIGGTAMNWAIKQGITSPEEIASAKSLGDAQKIAARIRKEYNAKFGSGQGANDVQLMGSHVQALGQMLRGEEGGAYKIPTYDTQKEDPTATGSVLDRHGAKAQAVVSPFNPPASYSNAEYGLVEPVNRGNASEMGLPDSGYQEAQWRGGGLFTGLKSPPNQDYAQIGENALLEHARLTNQSPQAAQRSIATGEQALFSMPAKRKAKMPSLFGDDY